jgi:hypothetical protein
MPAHFKRASVAEHYKSTPAAHTITKTHVEFLPWGCLHDDGPPVVASKTSGSAASTSLLLCVACSGHTLPSDRSVKERPARSHSTFHLMLEISYVFYGLPFLLKMFSLRAFENGVQGSGMPENIG